MKFKNPGLFLWTIYYSHSMCGLKRERERERERERGGGGGLYSCFVKPTGCFRTKTTKLMIYLHVHVLLIKQKSGGFSTCTLVKHILYDTIFHINIEE